MSERILGADAVSRPDTQGNLDLFQRLQQYEA